MKFFDILFSFFCVTFGGSTTTADIRDTFSAVTKTDNLTELYSRMRIRELHLEPDPNVDAETKKRICRSIMSSGYFEKDNLGVVDANKIHKLLKSVNRKQEKREPVHTRHIYYKKVLEDYVEIPATSILGTRKFEYTYRSRLIPFGCVLKYEQEFAFACMAQNRDEDFYVYYISDVYDINAALDVPTDRKIGARFICAAYWDKCELEAIAEEPATAYADGVEKVYLRMRQFYDHANATSDDPICGRSASEKLQVCASVMNSAFFVNKGLKYMPHLARLKAECDFNEVSFRTDEAKAEMTDDFHPKEWMLTCTGLVQETKDKTSIQKYFVSRAYQSQYAVVYSHAGTTNTWLVENISANISVIVERSLKIREGRATQPVPKLDELLEDLQQVTIVTKKV